MAAEPQSYEPEKLTAGMTWKWNKTISDYPASEWTLTYYLRINGSTAVSFSATADGDTFIMTVPITTTQSIGAGIHDFIGVAIKTSVTPNEKIIVFDGALEVLPNPFNSSAYDPRSHARRVMELIEAAMEGRIPNGMESYSIGGRSLNKIPLGQLRELYEKYKQDVEQEVQAERLANGRKSGKNIGIRFNKPSGINVQGYSYIG